MDENFKDFDDVYILKSKLLAILKEAREKIGIRKEYPRDDQYNTQEDYNGACEYVDGYNKKWAEDLAILDEIISKIK